MKTGQKRARYIDTIVEHYWERWRKEYVGSLRNWKQNYKRRNTVVPEVNDVVIVFDEKLPRHKWLFGRIIELIPSKDGQCRGAKLILGKTKAVIERPISKLYPIELERKGDKCHSENPSDNVIELISNEKVENVRRERPKRDAAVVADMRLKCMS